ncbi:hypothetical protein B0H14DRAFT_2682198 [Mycena olivaceomarginata]|nr:hypothetical protein B0H14DRAFT_2682198 [Mycena olivaceomarginata]
MRAEALLLDEVGWVCERAHDGSRGCVESGAPIGHTCAEAETRHRHDAMTEEHSRMRESCVDEGTYALLYSVTEAAKEAEIPARSKRCCPRCGIAARLGSPCTHSGLVYAERVQREQADGSVRGEREKGITKNLSSSQSRQKASMIWGDGFYLNHKQSLPAFLLRSGTRVR